MQPLRRWVPGPARDAASARPAPTSAPMPDISLQDVEFCSELHRHGGVAVAEQGFAAEGELLRMRQAGLLELQRDQDPPYAITRVALSLRVQELLSSRLGKKASGGQASVTDNATRPPATQDPKQIPMLRRNGFEVARGMCNAAVKSEMAAWKAAGGPGGYAALEKRVLMRIAAIEVPFST